MKDISKYILVILVLVGFSNSSFSQILRAADSSGSSGFSSENGGDREGGVLIETGYTITGGLFGGTGAQVVDQGFAATSIVFEGGYFLTDRFALKGKVGILTGGGSSLYNFAAGGKYYLLDVIPIELMAGFIGFSGSGVGDSVFGYTVTAGYAFALSDDIYLEPGVGVNVVDGNLSEAFKISFALVLGR